VTHPEATKNIKNKIENVVKKCVIEDKWPVFNSVYNNTIELSKEVLKKDNYGKWLTEDTLLDIIYDNISESLNTKFPQIYTLNYLRTVTQTDDEKKISGLLTELLEEEATMNLVNGISDLIASIPRKYKVYIPLPNIINLNAKQVSLSEDISFVKFDENDIIPKYKEGLFFEELALARSGVNKFEVDRYYIVIEANGYIIKYNDEITFIDVLSKFKQIMQMGIILDLFTKPFTTTRRTSFKPRDGMNAIIIDMKDPNHISAFISLPDSIIPFANNVALSTNSKKNLQTLEKKEIEITKYIKTILEIPIQLISIQSEDKDAKAIKAAVEWAFDSSLEENETISFIQTCIGIEAIIGEETEKESLTEKLADRCAYLLAQNISQRNVLRNEFRKLYKLRSKIVHGRTMSLNDNEKKYLYWGKGLLARIIKKEISLSKF